MVLTAEQERVKTLIADTVSLLCKNGLHYTKEFCIEGLLGITLDRDDIFLVNIKEIVRSENFKDDSDSVSGSGDESVKSPATKRHRKRKNQKRTASNCDVGDYESDNDMNSSAHPGNFTECGEPESKNIKQENDDSEDDLVFVKNEPGSISDKIPCSFPSSLNVSGASNDILSDLSQQGQLYATPTSNPLPGPSWDHPVNPPFSQSMIGQSPSLSIPTTPQQPLQAQQQGPTCLICMKKFKSNSGYHIHVNSHRGIVPYKCTYCQKGFKSCTTMKEHMTSHTNINYFKCEQCDLDFRHHYKLRMHKNAVHKQHEQSNNVHVSAVGESVNTQVTKSSPSLTVRSSLIPK